MKYPTSHDRRMELSKSEKTPAAGEMVPVLLQMGSKMRPIDLDWIQKIDGTTPRYAFSKRQKEVIVDIYGRYFD